ncbi:hypothetical protein RHGRI_016389 [Rhododendron griersonianum]|uniref:Uncharacterized protein n=1 Tax=Rhododendron griersonianum TaxID=479676 RepID=A0AAV6JU13_9ERIC|nr:hypothetical protein RHGRI_016389 [Rhododendron griersonianum]
MASFGKNFDALFPPLGLSSTTSASKFGFPGPHKSVTLLSNNSLHCGSVPILVNGSGTSVDNQGVSSSVGRVNLLDILESVPDHLEIQVDDTPTVKQIKGLTKGVSALGAELDSKNKLGIALSGGVEMGPSWKDKVAPPGVSRGGDSAPTPLEGFEPAVIMPASTIRELPCSNQFEALQLGDSTVDTSAGVTGLEVAEVSLSSDDSVIQDSLVGAPNGFDPSSSKGMEMVQDGTLPDVLGVGMADPDALFQALTSKEMENLHKPNEGKNPGAAKRGRKPKKQ